MIKNKKFIFAGAAYLGIFAHAASASAIGCHLNTSAAIGCLSPDVAAMAYEKFGFDALASNKPNIQALLRESQCLSAGQSYRTIRIKEFEHGSGRVPTGDGWVDVKYLYVENGQYPLYFASKYVDGVCDKFQPVVIEGK